MGLLSTFWTPKLDALLLKGIEAGLSRETIASQIGATKNMVIGRSHRLRGKTFPSDLERNAAATNRKNGRRQERTRQVEALSQYIANCKNRKSIIFAFHKQGYSQSVIGAAAGVTRQRISQILSAGQPK